MENKKTYAGEVLRLPTPCEAAPPKEKRLFKRAGGSVSFLWNFVPTFSHSRGHVRGRKARTLGLLENVLIKQNIAQTAQTVRSITATNSRHLVKMAVNPRIDRSEARFAAELNRILSAARINRIQDLSRAGVQANGLNGSKPRENGDHQNSKPNTGAGLVQNNYLS